MKQSMQLLTSSQTDAWYTPPYYIELVRQVLGDIDLDPASCAAANSWIRAKKFYTEADDGLSKKWAGRLFINCPYGKTGARSNQDIWSKRLISEFMTGDVVEAILLTKSVPGYKWWEHLFHNWPVCMAQERIKFLKLSENGEVVKVGQAKAGSSFWYFGPQYVKFDKVFRHVGRIIEPRPVVSIDEYDFWARRLYEWKNGIKDNSDLSDLPLFSNPSMRDDMDAPYDG